MASASGSRARPSAREQDSRRRCSTSNSIGLYRALHHRGRVASEARLKRTYDRLANARQRSLGLGSRADPVPHLITLGIKEHVEELFARLGVVRQSSVCEAESTVPADVVQHATAVQ